MAYIINGTVKTTINNDTAVIMVVSYGYYNQFNFEDRNELTIKFTNLNQGHTVNELNGKALEITIDNKP